MLILKFWINELIRTIPVLCLGDGDNNNTDKFVVVTNIPTWSIYFGNKITVTTGALKVDIKLDLIGIS